MKGLGDERCAVMARGPALVALDTELRARRFGTRVVFTMRNHSTNQRSAIAARLCGVSLRTAAVLGTAAILSLAVVSVAGAQGASASDVSANGSAVAIYDRAAKHWGGLHSVIATFEQRIHNSLLNRTATSRGTFVQQRPNLVNITFTDPVGDQVIGDGKWLWVFLPSSTPGQVVRLPAESDGAVVADMLGQLLDTPRTTFTITGGDEAVVENRTTHRVTLVPREGTKSTFQRATLWIDETEARPVRVQVLDMQGVDRTITLTSWTTNTKVPSSVFKFNMPKGVKVVDRMPGT